MAAGTTSLVVCPAICCAGKCGGEAVIANFGTFSATTVRVAACTFLERQGWGRAPQLVLRKSEAGRLKPAGQPATVVRHRDGLVGFSG